MLTNTFLPRKTGDLSFLGPIFFRVIRVIRGESLKSVSMETTTFFPQKQAIYLFFNLLFFRVIRVFPWLIIKISIYGDNYIFSPKTSNLSSL